MKSTIKTQTRLLFKSLILLTCISILGINASSQCDGVYQKPISHQILPVGADFGAAWGQPAIDLTGDGILDLVGIGVGAPDRLLIYPGIGDLTFGAPKALLTPTGTITWKNRFVDVNSDGFPDVVFEGGVNNYATLSVNLNDGNGNFTPLPTFSLDANTWFLAWANVNGDHAIDLVAGAPYEIVYYRPGNADGTFGQSVPLPAGFGASVGDFDGDGSTDFLGYVNGETRIFFNDGEGNFTPAVHAVSIPNFWGVIGDLNNDGKSDLLSRDAYYQKFGVSLGNSDGTFETALYDVRILNLFLPFFTSADLTGDSFNDLLANSNYYYDVFTNDGTGHFTGRHYDSPLKGKPSGDFDNDGRADFVSFTSNRFGESQVTIWKNTCGSFGQSKIVDFDRDRATDLALWNEDTGIWRYMNSNPWTESGQPFSWGTSGDIPVPGDYDGDLATDLAVFRPSNGVWYVYNPATNSATYTSFGRAEDKPVASDYDGDGKTDIAVYRPSEGNWYILSSATGHYSVVRFGMSDDRPIPADYDGDGKSDVAVYRPSTGVWYVLKSSDGNFTATNWGLQNDIPVPGDHDGDGKADLVVFRPAEGNWYILRSYNNQYGIFHFGMDGDIPQPGDWDGNGIMDLGVYRPSTNTWYRWNEIVFGSAGDRPVSSVLPAN